MTSAAELGPVALWHASVCSAMCRLRATHRTAITGFTPQAVGDVRTTYLCYRLIFIDSAFLVELGGIEPPSESHCRADLHA